MKDEGRMFEWEREHDLKCDTDSYQLLVKGVKLFEIRNNDRLFQTGDRLRLREVSREGIETGYFSFFGVTCVVSGYGLKEGYVALGVEPALHLQLYLPELSSAEK